MSLINRDYSNLKHFSVMALQDQLSKNCKKRMSAHKGKSREMVISLFKYNQPKMEIPTSIYKMGGPIVKLSLISWILIIPFNFGYDHIINSSLKKCTY